MAQLFSNGVDTTLAATLTIGGTSATLADGSALSAPTGGDYELVTLIAAGNFEIVRMTARAANIITITRAQESTTAREWPTGTRVVSSLTAGSVNLLRSPDPVQIGVSANASGSNSVAIGNTAVATAADSVSIGNGSKAVGDIDNINATAVGRNAWAEGDYGVAVGYDAWAAKLSSVAVGASAYSQEQWGVAVGLNARSRADYATAIGGWAETSIAATEAVAIGAYADVTAIGSMAVGANATCSGDYSIALGPTFVPATVDHVIQIEALPVAPRWSTAQQTGANAAWRMSGAQSVIMSEPLDLKTLQTHTITIPGGVTFYPEEVGVVVTAANTVSGQPTLRFGITGDETKYLAATATAGLAAVRDRHVYGSLASTAGAQTLRAEITVAATGTTLTGRVYWKGFAVVDQ